MRGPGPAFFLYETSLKKTPVETYLNPQRSSRRPPSWIFIRNILFILPLGAEWME